MKEYAILGGMDWTDASVEHIALPDNVNIDDLFKEYKNWNDEQQKVRQAWLERNPDYRKKMPEGDPYPSYKSFYEWLLDSGNAEESEVTEWWEGVL